MQTSVKVDLNGVIYDIPRDTALELSKKLNAYFAVEAKANGYDIRKLRTMNTNG